MAESRGIARPIVFFLCIAVTAAGLNNVYGSNAEVIAKAETVACGKPSCSVQMTAMSRNPITQTFTFQIAPQGQGSAMVSGSRSVNVDCTREYLLVGAYECARATP
jgi:hypothetical protein